MFPTAEKQLEQIGMTRDCEDHDYEMLHELESRWNFLGRHEQRFANQEGNPSLRYLRRLFQREERESLEKIKMHTTEQFKKCCF